MRQASFVPLVIGAPLLALWAAWGAVCAFWTGLGLTISYSHHLCAATAAQYLAPVSCSRLSEIYAVSTVAFWAGAVLTGWFTAWEVLSRRAISAAAR
ncbi:MAG TPA: hypothetical protein VMV92_07765 [Streptosporangiaceae bacterium]|nr:hypothetical protein [Streptosporangiaceae bacterium]